MSNKQEFHAPRQLLRKKARKFVTLFLLGILLVGSYLLWQYSQKEAVGVIQMGPPPADWGEKGQKIRLYKGKYVEFSLPEQYAEKSHTVALGDPIQESIFFSTSDLEGKKIALVVAKRGTDLMSDPSFKMRTEAEALYKQTSMETASWQGVLFENDTPPFEMTVFFVHRESIVSVSITSPFKKAGLQEELGALVESLRFKTD